MFQKFMAEAAEAAGLQLSDNQLQQFTRYYEMLIEWNEKMNLTAITEAQEVAVKHMVDSLTALETGLFAEGATVIDVGTGAGFPGLPLKIYRPDLKLTLMDSLQKRVGFLEAVVEELGLQEVACVHARAEEGARNKAYREKFDLAVSRAVAALPVLAEYTLPFVKKGGFLVALKGAKYAEEAEAAVRALSLLGGSASRCQEVALPGLEDKRAIVTVKKLKPTPKAYPRKAGTPTKKPL